MANSALVSMAILKVNWDDRQRDFLDNFVPFVLECLRTSPDDVVSVPELQQQIQERFKFRLPLNTLKSLLKRARHKNYLLIKNDVYHKNHKSLAQVNFNEVEQQVIRRHEALIASLCEYCANVLHINWTSSIAETAILAYFEDNQVALMNGIINDASQPPDQLDALVALDQRKYIIGAFLLHLKESGSEVFDYVLMIVKGTMLAHAVSLIPDVGQVQRRFNKTEIYLDTSLLIHALGYEGHALQEPAKELLQMLRDKGAQLCCLQHTVDEIEGILSAAANRSQDERRRRAGGLPNEFLLAPDRMGTDFWLLADQLPTHLKQIGVDIRELPEMGSRVKDVIHQPLSERLTKDKRYSNPRALQRDVESICAIYQLRSGNQYIYLEDCRAIFVTRNSYLSDVVRELLPVSTDPPAVPLCITDIVMTNLVWLKSPGTESDIPTKRLIAESYAATQPDDALWTRYIQEAQRLERDGLITPDQLSLLRYAIEAKSELMRQTLGEEKAFTQGTVQEVLRHVQEQLTEEYRNQLLERELNLQQAEERIASVQREKDEMRRQQEEQERRRDIRLSEISSRIAQVIALFATGIVIFLLFAISFIVSPLSSTPTESTPSLIRILFAIAALLTIVFGVLNFVLGTTVKVFIDRFEKWVAARIKQLLKTIVT
jgi:hypothetical protein